MSRFSENFNDLLRIKGYTQTSFAQKLGVKQNTVSQWAKGLREPDLECLIDICYILETTPNDILSYQQEIAEKQSSLNQILELFETTIDYIKSLPYKERRKLFQQAKLLKKMENENQK